MFKGDAAKVGVAETLFHLWEARVIGKFDMRGPKSVKLPSQTSF